MSHAVSPSYSAPNFVSVSELSGKPFVWNKPNALKRDYSLYCAGDLVMRMSVPWWRYADARGEAAEGRWKIVPHGALAKEADVLERIGGRRVAKFRRQGMNEGLLEVLGEENFFWRKSTLSEGAPAFVTEAGMEVARIDTLNGPGKARAMLKLSPHICASPSAPFLLLVSMFDWARRPGIRGDPINER
jgi:hypothetical protein